MIKNIYRIAIINNKDEVIYLSGIFFYNKKAAFEEIEKLTNFKEEAKPQESIEVCITIANNYTWKIFEKIKKDSKKICTVGIITEALFIEDTDRLEK